MGELVGRSEGVRLGDCEGAPVEGDFDGAYEGALEGDFDGAYEGALEGDFEGALVVGVLEGGCVGVTCGELDGVDVSTQSHSNVWGNTQGEVHRCPSMEMAPSLCDKGRHVSSHAPKDVQTTVFSHATSS